MRKMTNAMSIGALTLGIMLSGCAEADTTIQKNKINVVTTTGILADITRNIAGENANVTSIVPDGADPHSYEPHIRDVRSVVYADAAFSNYLMLEEQKTIKMLDANLRAGVPNVPLAEASAKYSAEIIPLVENVSLDAPWLGLRVAGKGEKYGADRGSQIILKATGATGPGSLFAYLTGSFGEVEKYFDSSDGFNAADGFRDDSATLPPDAHTHLSWAFTKPGYYSLNVSAEIQAKTGQRPTQLGTSTIYFAVGVDPHAHPDVPGAEVISEGHVDYTIDVDNGAFVLDQDIESTDPSKRRTTTHKPEKTVVEVPARTQLTIPGERQFRFLGKPGASIYSLPQAVLGKHVHGEIDPHLWHNVRNVIAYAQAIRDTLIKIDGKHALEYRKNTDAYIAKLNELDGYMWSKIQDIPESRRLLVTTHDAFAYLAKAYDLKVAGFITPNPGVEPSVAARKKLAQTMQTLHVPAVFTEPALAEHARTLQEVATENHVQVCHLYGDAFDERVKTYIDLMRHNADELVRCLG